MRFRNLKRRLYTDQRPLEEGEIVGDGGVMPWDMAFDYLLEPLDQEAKAAFAALQRGPGSVRTPTDPNRPDAYQRTGQEVLRTGIDPTKFAGTQINPQSPEGKRYASNPSDRPKSEGEFK